MYSRYVTMCESCGTACVTTDLYSRTFCKLLGSHRPAASITLLLLSLIPTLCHFIQPIRALLRVSFPCHHWYTFKLCRRQRDCDTAATVPSSRDFTAATPLAPQSLLFSLKSPTPILFTLSSCYILITPSSILLLHACYTVAVMMLYCRV